MRRLPHLFLILLSLSVLFLCTEALAAVSCTYKTQRVECGKLACSKTEHVCVRCTADNDCYPASMECAHGSGRCHVRTLQKGFSWRTVLAMVCGVAVCAIGIISGAGGGGIIVPMFAGLLQFPLETAVGTSQVTVCGQSILNVYMSSRRKYVDSMWDRPLINYQYLNLIFPLGLLGTLFGILNTVLPDALRLVLLFSLLSVVLYRTILKTLKQYKKDIEHKKPVFVNDDDAEPPEAPAEAATTPEAPVSHNIPQEQYPVKYLLLYLFYFILLLLSNVTRLFCTCGGAIYYLTLILPAIILFGGYCYAYRSLRDFHAVCPDVITFRWSRKTALYYPLVAIFAGAAGAILGIGGVMILGFILYEIDLIPDEVSVTSNVVTCFIALSSASCALLKRDVPYDFAVIFFGLGLISTLIGNMILLKEIRKRGLKFLIILSLAFITFGSLIATGTYSIINILEKDDRSDILSFGKLCLPKI